MNNTDRAAMHFRPSRRGPAGSLAPGLRSSRLRPRLEWMEDRTLLSTFLVANTNNSGPGSLRQAILDSNQAPGGPNTIDFGIQGTGPRFIHLTSPLPAPTVPTILDGTTQPGYSGSPLISVVGDVLSAADPLSVGPQLSLKGVSVGGATFTGSAPVDNLAIVSASFSVPGAPEPTYPITVSLGGTLVATVTSPANDPTIELLDGNGNVLTRSDGSSSAGTIASIDTYLAPGTYSLRVSDSGISGTFSLSASLTASEPPAQPIPVGNAPAAIATGDFAGNGRIDLAIANERSNTVSILMGNGDGTFQPPETLPVGSTPVAIVAGDFSGNGKVDLAVVNQGDSSVSILIGNGNGSFSAGPTYDLTPTTSLQPANPTAIAAAPFSGTGVVDLAVTCSGLDAVLVLIGNGDGTFRAPVSYSLGPENSGADAILASHFGGGVVSLAVVNGGSNDVSILRGNGDGTFSAPVNDPVGGAPVAIASGDLAGNGQTDLVVANSSTNDISILMGNGDGTFQTAVNQPAGIQPHGIAVGHFLGNSSLDLAVVSFDGDSILILSGNGDGTFLDGATLPVGSEPYGIVAGDFNQDGRTDLAVPNLGTNTVSILLGNGAGNLLGQSANTTRGILSMATGLFNGNGQTDLAIADAGTMSISILLGNGDGTFQAGTTISLGFEPSAILAGYFHGPGHPEDLAVLDTLHNRVAILQGNGDGSFQPPVDYQVGNDPVSFASGDLAGNGIMDIVVANALDNTIEILAGNGEGTFRPNGVYPVGSIPGGIDIADINGDGKPDLVVVNEGSDSLSLLLGNGDGTFQSAHSQSLHEPGYIKYVQPEQVIAQNFGNGQIDLAIVNYNGTISVLLGDGRGNFAPPVYYPVPFRAVSMVAGDFVGNGRIDLAVSDDYNGDVAIFMSNGDGTFQPAQIDPLGAILNAPVTGHFRGGPAEALSIVSVQNGALYLRTRSPDGSFSAPMQADAPPLGNPVVADFNGDGVPDVLVVDANGSILYRQGLAGHPGLFVPPLVINAGHPSRDIAFIPQTIEGPLLASVDALDNGITLYAYRNGDFVTVGSLSTGVLPAQVIAADLGNTGWDDLIVRNAGDGTLSVFVNAGFGGQPIGFVGPVASVFPNGFGNPFPRSFTIPVGVGASSVQAIDTTGLGRLDLVVTNQLTGEVTVLPNLGSLRFGAPASYRAGTGLDAVDPSSGPQPTGLDVTAGVAGGALVPGGPVDLVTINPGTSTIGILYGLGDGRFANPLTIQGQSPEQFLRMANFQLNGIPDLAVLTNTGLEVYLGDGRGHFKRGQTYPIPPSADGLTVADLRGNGIPDLVVGDAYGDELVLFGNGDGTFQPYRPADQAIKLAVADLNGNGQNDIIYANSTLDRISIAYPNSQGTPSPLTQQSAGLLEPGAVALADLNGDGIPDLIVTDSGGNNVRIYPGLGNGQFGPSLNNGYGYFVGTNPVGITVAHLTGSLPDLIVADQGSNQVSILLNTSMPGGPISFDASQRLNSGGIGPVSTVITNVPGSPYPDIMVTNSGSNNVAMLQGVLPGFFTDQNIRLFSTGANPVKSFVGKFDGQPDLVTVNSGSSTLTVTSGFTSADPLVSTVSSGGLDPTTAFAFDPGGGYEDLVVGNSANGLLSLFDGSLSGLQMVSSTQEVSLPSPTDLSFATATSSSVSFYAATAGVESADLVTLDLSFAGSTTSGLSTASTATESASVQLVSLDNASLPLIASVLTLTLDTEGGAVAASPEESGASVAAASPSANSGQGSRSAHPTDRSGEETINEEIRTGDESPPPTELLPWERFLLGIDDARRALERRWLSHPEQVPSEVPGSTAPAAVREKPTDPPSPALTPATHSQASTDPVELVPDRAAPTTAAAIDAAIERLEADPQSARPTAERVPSHQPERRGAAGFVIGLAISSAGARWSDARTRSRRPNSAESLSFFPGPRTSRK